MTRAAIVETLAKRFSIQAKNVQSVLEMLDAGLTATYAGRVRRAESGCPEGVVRRIDRARRELDELDRRRGTILRMLEGRDKGDEPTDASSEKEGAESFPEIRACMDRFELEDLLLPHRRPEPEVQLALDRGLDELADRLVAPAPRPPKDKEAKDKGAEEPAKPADEPDAASEPAPEAPAAADAPVLDEAPAEAAKAADDATPDAADAPAAAPAKDATAEAPSTEPAPAAPETAAAEAKEAQPQKATPSAGGDAAAAGVSAHLPGMRDRVEITPQLARVCAESVNPDRGVHTEAEALAGAMRILSDRLGRSPQLRAAIRRMMRKQAILTVRATDESKLGRHRSLLKLKEPIRQLQGRRLLQIRQAQKDRAVTTTIALDPEVALPKVKQALGRRLNPDFQSVIDAVAEQAFTQRLLPMIEADIRLELKERGDEEALRFLAQHLRQVLLGPPGGPFPVCGMSINAKQDWILVILDGAGHPTSGEIKLETKDKDDFKLAEELGAALRDSGVRAIAMGNGKASLAQVPRVRKLIQILEADGAGFLVNEAGLSGYANSELARTELADFTVPARMAISLGRRYQDPLLEILKVDPRNLGLGMEAGLVSKANLRRTLNETVESCLAHVGCDVNTAPLAFLRRLPGLDAEAAKKLVAHREEQPFQSREDLRASGVLTEAQFTSCAAFLRVPGSPEPLDRTSLHPEQYPLARRVIEATGGTVQDVLGRRGSTKGMRRADFEIDEATWRDLMREISFPGRDPRPRLFFPRLLPPDTDPSTLEKNQVVEGIVSNVTSFGAFIDLGVGREGLVHVSEASSRYVRDARELLAVGQVVRARVLETSGQRIALSLKNVPEPERRRPAERDDHRRGRKPRRDDGQSKERWPELDRSVRAAQTRRDGMFGKSEGRRGGKSRSGAGGGGRGGGGGRAGGRGRGRDRRDDAYDAEAVRNAGRPAANYNPFADFFGGREKAAADPDKDKEAESTPPAEAAAEKAPAEKTPAEES